MEKVIIVKELEERSEALVNKEQNIKIMQTQVCFF